MFFSYIPHGFLSLKSRLGVLSSYSLNLSLALMLLLGDVLWKLPSAEHRKSINQWHQPSVNMSLFSIDTTELQLFTLLLLNSAWNTEREGKKQLRKKDNGNLETCFAVLPQNILSVVLFYLMTSFSQTCDSSIPFMLFKGFYECKI